MGEELIVKINDIVQVIPTHDWEGALIIVSEVKDWGILGFTQIPTKGQSYIRLNKSDYIKVGTALFIPEHTD